MLYVLCFQIHWNSRDSGLTMLIFKQHYVYVNCNFLSMVCQCFFLKLFWNDLNKTKVWLPSGNYRSNWQLFTLVDSWELNGWIVLERLILSIPLKALHFCSFSLLDLEESVLLLVYTRISLEDRQLIRITVELCSLTQCSCCSLAVIAQSKDVPYKHLLMKQVYIVLKIILFLILQQIG